MKDELKPSEKVTKYGFQTLLDFEVLSLILKSGTKGNSVFEIAKNLLNKANGIENITSLSYDELTSIKGISSAKALEIQAISELYKRIFKASLKIINMDNINKVVDYIKSEIAFEDVEVFMVLFLRNDLSLFKSEVLFKGTYNYASVNINEIIRKAIIYKSLRIIIAHNHTSFNANPSNQDISLTKNLANNLKAFQIELLDHVIVSKAGHFSFKQNNLL